MQKTSDNSRRRAALVKLAGTIEVQRNTMLATYRGLLVLRTFLKKQKQDHGVYVTDTILAELAEAMPELPGLSALR